MSMPLEYIEQLISTLRRGYMVNIAAQADARRILQEVKEDSENYPKFDSVLTEKATYIAYLSLSCGCEIIENEYAEIDDGYLLLERAGKILADAYQYSEEKDSAGNYNLLIAGMALYASKQYSRAFITLNNIEVEFDTGKMVAEFVKKNFNAMLRSAYKIFTSEAPSEEGIQEISEWIISHELARCFIIISDYIYSGEGKSIETVNEILSKILILAKESDLITYWLIIRLLKIILSTFQKVSLWSVLPPWLPDQSEYLRNNYIRLLGSLKAPVTELWPSQTASLPLAVGDNEGAVINLRTSGGKTRVAEIAIIRSLTKNLLTKVLYLAPFRSLAFEIEHSLEKVFRPLGITVSQLYGGATVSVSDLDVISDSQVIIATPEKAKALIRSGSGIENEIKTIVIDEGHLIGRQKREIKNEMFLSHLNIFAKQNGIRVLLLSAVLPNSDELAEWIGGSKQLVARSDWKPSLERLGLLIWDGNKVRLEWKSEGEPFNPSFIVKSPLGFGNRRLPFPNNKNEAIAATAVRLSKTGTVMIYSARANSINNLAKSVLLGLGEYPDDFDWDESLWNIFVSVCEEELVEEDIILEAARKGVICHNNKLPNLVRITIERLMRSKAPLIIIASSTLAQGVNIGISSVIVATPYYNQNPISNRDFWNICGRAGRAYTDVEGKILYAIDNTKEAWQRKKDRLLAQGYFDNQQMERANSGILAVLKAINWIAEEIKMDFEELLEIIANDDVDMNTMEGYSNWIGEYFDLLDDELLAMHESYSDDGENVDWIEDVFKDSLAIIQAEDDKKEDCIKTLKARTRGLIKRIPNIIERKRIISSGIPVSVAQNICDDREIFEIKALEYLNDIETGIEQGKCLNKIVLEIELWSLANAKSIIESLPSQEELILVRKSWLAGAPLIEIRKYSIDIEKITKDFYGFTLPWIINAIAQMFDAKIEEAIVDLYTSVAKCVELGLPNKDAVNIYMAGVRSRVSAVELSTLTEFHLKSVPEIKRTLSNFHVFSDSISDNTQAWINIFLEGAIAQKQRIIKFPSFTWEESGAPDKLYVRKVDNVCYLVSPEGYFMEEIESTEELPFEEIANIREIYLERSDDIWQLKSYSPFIKIQ
ncbi:hypothetical protein M2150_001794 [Lachnospiraceae bacterium PM6-15]|uniref:DEAD/DEAH box helicase n=1 Tax=Ohessyouella blattaphilus TaxID=2949333 RepID=UPI003E2FCE25